MNQNNKMNALCSKLYNLLEFISCSMLLSTDWKYDNQWLNTACLNKKNFFGRLPCSSHLLWVVTGWKILLRSPFWGTAPRPALIFCSWCLENKIIQFLHQYGILPYIMRIRIKICHFKGEFFKWLVLDFRNVCTVHW